MRLRSEQPARSSLLRTLPVHAPSQDAHRRSYSLASGSVRLGGLACLSQADDQVDVRSAMGTRIRGDLPGQVPGSQAPAR